MSRHEADDRAAAEPAAARPEPRTDPPNAFVDEFLRCLDHQDDEPDTATEADTAALWQVVDDRLRFAVLRHYESLEEGDRPAARGLDRYTALLVAAVLPAAGRNPSWHLGKEAHPDGSPLRVNGEEAGFLAQFDETLVAALNVADGLVRSPQSLALLLEAAGGLALRRVGRILAHTQARTNRGR